MLCYKLKTVLALVGIILVTFAAPVWAVEYNVGVSVGQWMTYGNFVAIGPGMPSDFNETLWMKLEVVEVTGKNITLHASGMYMNGTPAQETGMRCNVETGWMNVSGMYGLSIIIAANLQEGDTLPGTTPSLQINKTETRNYGGFITSVNILNFTYTPYPGYYYKILYVWDKPSGMLLEVYVEIQTTTYSKMSFSMTTTNIPEFPSNIILPLFMVFTVVATLCIKKRAARKTKT